MTDDEQKREAEKQERLATAEKNLANARTISEASLHVSEIAKLTFPTPTMAGFDYNKPTPDRARQRLEYHTRMAAWFQDLLTGTSEVAPKAARKR